MCLCVERVPPLGHVIGFTQTRHTYDSKAPARARAAAVSEGRSGEVLRRLGCGSCVESLIGSGWSCLCHSEPLGRCLLHEGGVSGVDEVAHGIPNQRGPSAPQPASPAAPRACRARRRCCTTRASAPGRRRSRSTRSPGSGRHSSAPCTTATPPATAHRPAVETAERMGAAAQRAHASAAGEAANTKRR